MIEESVLDSFLQAVAKDMEYQEEELCSKLAFRECAARGINDSNEYDQIEYFYRKMFAPCLKKAKKNMLRKLEEELHEK